MPPSPSSSSSLPPLSPVNADGNNGGRGGRIIITRSEGGNGLVVRVATKEDDDDDAVGSDAGGGGGDARAVVESLVRAAAAAAAAASGEEEKDSAPPTGDAREGWTAAHVACDAGDAEGLRRLLEHGADPNPRDALGATPLHVAIAGAGRRSLARLHGGVGDVGGGGGGRIDVGKPVPTNPPPPGKKKSASKGPATAAGCGGGDGGDFLEDYLKCLRHLMDCDRFDLMTNERGEGGGGGRRREARKGDPPRRRAPPPDDDAGTEGSKKKKDGGGRNGGLFVVGPPEDADGLGISPLCLCVGRLVGAGDALRPLLDLLLARGFDSNATENVVARGGGVGGSGGGGGGAASSALHIALRNAHHGCALALARAGANVNAPRPEDGVTALRVASATYGDGFARELREAGVVAMAVADPSRRRDLLRSPGGEGGKKLARRAANAGKSFVGASRWREAACAYSEAASYGPGSLPERERFEVLRSAAECFLQVERGQKSEEAARQLLGEFPRVPLAMVALGEAISHPSCGKLTPEQLREIEKLADEALKAEKKSDGKEWWKNLDAGSKRNPDSAVIRALKLKGLVEGRTNEQNPAVKVANTALDEYFTTTGGSIEKAAFAIELALKPELNHPNPLPLHGIRGFVYYSWASEILRANSHWKSDRDRKDGLLREMSPLKNKLSFREAQEKIRVAFDEFEYYRMKNVFGEFPHLMYGFNVAKTNFALGKFDEGKRFALSSIKERAEDDLVRLDESGTRPKQDDRFEGGSTQKLILQLNWALDMNRMLVTQMVVDYATNADSSTSPLPPLIAQEPMVQSLKLKDDVINTPQLRVLLEKAVTFRLLDKPSVKRLLEKISGNPIKVNAAIRGLFGAMKILETGYQAMTDLRVEVGKVIMNFVAGAHRMQKQTKSSSRVVGSLLMEALEWDRNVEIPKDLPKMYLKMAQEFAQAP